MSIRQSLNYYSLDAPFVLAAWLGLLSYWATVNLPWWLYLWLAVIVWLAYTWDRLIDSSLQPRLVDIDDAELFSKRHAQHKKYQKLIFLLQIILVPFILWGFILLPQKIWPFTPLMGLLCIIYLGLTYIYKKHLHSFNFLGGLKHLWASVILIYGLFILINSYEETNLINLRFIMVIALTAYVFWLNMRCCEYWDGKNKSSHTKYYLSLEITLLLLLLCISYFTSYSLVIINLPLSFILIMITTLSSYLALLVSPYHWMQNFRLFWADMCLIIYPFLILGGFNLLMQQSAVMRVELV